MSAKPGEGEMDTALLRGDTRLRDAVVAAIDRRGVLALTLHGQDGMGMRADDVAKALKHFVGLVTEVAKEVEPTRPLEWRVSSAAAIDDAVKIEITAHPRRPAARRKANP